MTRRARFIPKVAIYGIGVIGKMCVQILHDKGWEIVAAYNRAGDKVGQDLGRLAGLDKDLGIIVQDYENANYSKLVADVALVAGSDYLDECLPIYERFLKAGVNVLSLGSHAYQPYIMNPEIAQKIDLLARENGVTFTGGGLWDMTRIWAGLIAAGPCVQIDAIDYFTDVEALRQGLHWAPRLGMGMTIEEFDEKIGRVPGRANEILKIPAIIILQQYGYKVTDVTMRQEPVVFDEPVYSPELEKEIPVGVCVGTQMTIDVNTKQGVTARSHYVYRIFKPGEIEHGTWKISGSPGMEVRVVRHDTGVALASSLINRIPDVLDAKPGIVTIMEMGPQKHSAFL